MVYSQQNKIRNTNTVTCAGNMYQFFSTTFNFQLFQWTVVCTVSGTHYFKFLLAQQKLSQLPWTPHYIVLSHSEGREINFYNKFIGIKLVGFREAFHQLLSFLLTSLHPAQNDLVKNQSNFQLHLLCGVHLALDITTEHLRSFSGVIILCIHLSRNKVKVKQDNSLFKMKLNHYSSVYSFFSSEATGGLADDSCCSPQTIHFLLSRKYWIYN